MHLLTAVPWLRATLFLAVFAVGVTWPVADVQQSTAAHADPQWVVSGNEQGCTRDVPVRWRGVLIVYGVSETPRGVVQLPQYQSQMLDMFQASRHFADLVVDASRCTVNVEMHIEYLPPDVVWRDMPNMDDAEGYDFVMYAYPRTSLDENYLGLTARRWVKLPVTVSSPAPAPAVMLHEFLHVLTGWVQERNIPVTLPEGDVHAPSTHPELAKMADVAFYTQYWRGSVEVSGQYVGLGVQNVVAARTPTNLEGGPDTETAPYVQVKRVKLTHVSGKLDEVVRYRTYGYTTEPLRVSIYTQDGVTQSGVDVSAEGKEGEVQSNAPVEVCAETAGLVRCSSA